MGATTATNKSQIASVKAFIKSNWPNTIRTPQSQSPSEIFLPEPFSVSTIGSLFQLFYYWDTFFICEGLLRNDFFDQALHNTNNLLFLIDTFGFVPNNSFQGLKSCSHPPVTALLVEKIFQITGDKQWLKKALPLLEKEYAFWSTYRSGTHSLNHYGWHGYPIETENFYWSIKDRFVDIPGEPVERMSFLAHALAEVESGWEFTPRFKRRCADFYAVDLNSLLFIYETNIAIFHDLLGNESGSKWRKRALQRRTQLNKFCWNDEKGFYFDFDFSKDEPLLTESASAFFALWAGIASIDQATRILAKLPILEYKYGIVSCCPESQDKNLSSPNPIYVWDFPYAWPPVQYAVIAGLLRYGYTEESLRIATKFVDCVTINFQETGNLWKRYNAVTGGTDTSNDEKSPPMLGWTAGTYLYALDIIKQITNG
jgi:alpha,alpha-trehalase